MSDLDGYQVTFKQDPTRGWWTYEIETPDGRTMRPVIGRLDQKGILRGAGAAADRGRSDDGDDVRR